MVSQKKYRVLCNQERFTDNIFVDIAPENGVTHDMMFYSRLQLFRTTSSQVLEDCGTSSIYMTVIDGHEPELDFSYRDPGVKRTWEHQSYMKMCNRLRPLIIQAYKNMIAAGKESTLDYIMSPIEVENYKDVLNRNSSDNHHYKEKHLDDLQVRTPHEEREMLIRREFMEQKKRREASNHMHAVLDQRMSPINRLKQRSFRDGD